MADLSLTVVPVATGIADLAAEAVAATALGDTAPVGPGRVLYVNNTDAAPHTVTVTTPGTVRGLAVADASLTVAAGDHGLIPLPRIFAGTDGRAAVTYDDVTGLTVAALELES